MKPVFILHFLSVLVGDLAFAGQESHGGSGYFFHRKNSLELLDMMECQTQFKPIDLPHVGTKIQAQLAALAEKMEWPLTSQFLKRYLDGRELSWCFASGPLKDVLDEGWSFIDAEQMPLAERKTIAISDPRGRVYVNAKLFNKLDVESKLTLFFHEVSWFVGFTDAPSTAEPIRILATILATDLDHTTSDVLYRQLTALIGDFPGGSPLLWRTKQDENVRQGYASYEIQEKLLRGQYQPTASISWGDQRLELTHLAPDIRLENLYVDKYKRVYRIRYIDEHFSLENMNSTLLCEVLNKDNPSNDPHQWRLPTPRELFDLKERGGLEIRFAPRLQRYWYLSPNHQQAEGPVDVISDLFFQHEERLAVIVDDGRVFSFGETIADVSDSYPVWGRISPEMSPRAEEEVGRRTSVDRPFYAELGWLSVVKYFCVREIL